eukprot:437763_1
MLIFTLIYIVTHTCTAIKSIKTETLLVTQVNKDGFGDINNQYAFSMESFKGYLYVGTMNILTQIGQFEFFSNKPLETNGSQIYKGYISNINKWEWMIVVKEGNGNKDNFGVRKLTTIGDYLYGVTTNHVSGFEVWRTFDGSQWEIVACNGFGDTDNTSGRGLIMYNSYIYVGVENRKTGAKIWRHPITEKGDFEINSNWEEIINDGLGSNIWFSDFIQYKNWLYIGTLNVKGMELWRTDGIKFNKVFDIHATISHFDTAVMKLYVYNNILYVGTQNDINGASLYANIDDEGIIFKPIFTKGNGDPNNKYVWYMQEFNNRLYLSTFNLEKIWPTSGKFSLFSSKNPQSNIWTTETLNAFGNDGHFGIRSMTVFNERLMMGTATAQQDMACKVFEGIPRVQTNNAYFIIKFKSFIIQLIFIIIILIVYNFYLVRKIYTSNSNCQK